MAAAPALDPTVRPGRTSTEPFPGARPVDLAADTDLTTLPVLPRSIYVGTGGVIKVDCLDIDLTTVLIGKLIPVSDGSCPPFACIRKIYATANGTTASGLWIGV